MDFLSKCTRTGLLLAAWPVKVLSLAPMKMFAWIAPGKLAAIMEANMNENMKVKYFCKSKTRGMTHHLHKILEKN